MTCGSRASILVNILTFHLFPFLQFHILECQFSRMMCPRGCGQRILKARMEEHLKKVCSNRTVACQTGCGFKGRPSSMPVKMCWNLLVIKSFIKIKEDPLDLSFWSFLTFLHRGVEEVERHLLRKFDKKIQRKSWSNVPPKLVACVGFLYKVVHKTGRLRKFNRSSEIEFNFITAWTISMKFGTLVQHASGYKRFPQIF